MVAPVRLDDAGWPRVKAWCLSRSCVFFQNGEATHAQQIGCTNEACGSGIRADFVGAKQDSSLADDRHEIVGPRPHDPHSLAGLLRQIGDIDESIHTFSRAKETDN